MGVLKADHMERLMQLEATLLRSRRWLLLAIGTALAVLGGPDGAVGVVMWYGMLGVVAMLVRRYELG